MDKPKNQSLAILLILFILLSSCTATPTPNPSTLTPTQYSPTITPELTETMTPSPIPPTIIPELTGTPTSDLNITISPTPIGMIAFFTDEEGDGMHAPGEQTCLPDYMDYISATYFKIEDGGLKIVVDTAAPIPEDFEGSNNGFSLQVFFQEIDDYDVKADEFFDVLSTSNQFSSITNVIFDVNQQEIVFNIGPQIISKWPEDIYVRLESNYFPPGLTTGCVDSFPEGLLNGMLINIR